MTMLRKLGLARERRGEPRLKLPVMVIVGVSRIQGNLLDIAHGGASVESFAALKRNDQVRFVLRFRTLKVELNSRVLACRVVALKPRTTYVSRLQFIDAGEAAQAAITDFMRLIEEVGRRTWQRTESGYARPTRTPRAIIAIFTQLVKREDGWEETLLFDPEQPADGVTLPSNTPTIEITRFCETYDAADAAGRALLKEQAEALCDAHAEGQEPGK